MSIKFNRLLSNPICFRYAFVFISMVNVILLFFIKGEHLYVFYTLGIVFLGIGFYNYSYWILSSFITLLVVGVFLLEVTDKSVLNFIFLGVTYILILHISVEFMKRHQKIKEDGIELIKSLSKALDSRDNYTAYHSENVSRYAMEIGKKMKLPEEKIKVLKYGGLLHDIGKIGIPESVLLKPDGLTNEEYQIIKSHPTIGYNMIKHVKDFKTYGILDIVLYHHERYDGKGYPTGLKGDEIPLLARITAIADTFDAMTSKRVYRNEINLANTLKEIEKNKGTQFDPEITDVFLSLFKEKNDLSLNEIFNTYEKNDEIQLHIS